MESARLRKILTLSLPIIGGMTSQNVLNLVDTAMVGTLGDAALAAVGMGSFATFMCQAFITGLSAGVQAVAARRKGEGNEGIMAAPLNGGLLLAVGLALPWSAILFFSVPALFPYLHSDAAVVAQGVPYLQARVLAVAAVGMNFAFRGYWNGVSLSRLYFRTLLVMHASNVALNYILIFGKLGAPQLGVAGAGIGSAVATFIGTAYYFVLGLRHARNAGFLRRLPDVSTMKTLLRLSIPNGIQQFFFAAGFTTLFWIVGRVGTEELAAANVVLNISLVAVLPGLGLGLAAASLVGQALGRGDTEDARAWGWDVVKITFVVMSVLGIPMVFMPQLVLSAFIHDEETLMLARGPLMLVGATIGFEALGMVLLNALLGAGDSRRVMAVTVIMQWLLFLPAAYLIGPVLGLGLFGIWTANVVYRGSQALIFGALWAGGRWATIRV